jgi:SAM-dependent methyltransferase
MSTTKDFEPILDDYAFFESHATEAARDAQAYAAQAAPLVEGSAPVRMLDFGCGTGSFTERLLARLAIAPARLRLSLVEPVRSSHERAALRLARFTDFPIEHADSLADLPAEQCDLIVANHVFYYVPDLAATLAQLRQRLAPGGLLLAAIAGNDNPLIQFWRAGFAMLGVPVPYHVAEDVAAALDGLGIAYKQQRVAYELSFDDTTENRTRIQRFLFAEYFERLGAGRVLGLFDPYASRGRIEIRTASVHFTIAGPVR